jgi:hypothetical protein
LHSASGKRFLLIADALNRCARKDSSRIFSEKRNESLDSLSGARYNQYTLIKRKTVRVRSDASDGSPQHSQREEAKG